MKLATVLGRMYEVAVKGNTQEKYLKVVTSVSKL